MSSDADDRLKKWLEGEEEDDGAGAAAVIAAADALALG